MTTPGALTLPRARTRAKGGVLEISERKPYRRNPFFTGHEDILQTLHSTFQSKDKGIIPALAISGLGGIGKTQTALEYIYRYRHEYQAVLWCRAQTRELLTTDFTNIATLLDLPERHMQNQDCAVVAVKRWLSRESGWLLVLDNANDLEMVSDFLPELPVGHLLLTTCTQHTGQIARCIPLEKLSREESIFFLLQRQTFRKFIFMWRGICRLLVTSQSDRRNDGRFTSCARSGGVIY